MILSSNLENVHSDIRGEIYMHALELEKAGNKVLKLNTGNPAAFGFKMPESIKNRIIADVDKSLGYCDIRGMENARAAFKEYHLSRGVKNISENDIFIGNGVSEVAYMIISALIGTDDEVLVPTPCYSLWTNFTFLAGGKMIEVTKLNGLKTLINPDLIETVESNPDTVISFTTGRKIIVKESRQEVNNLVKLYRKELFARD